MAKDYNNLAEQIIAALSAGRQRKSRGRKVRKHRGCIR